MPDAEMLYQVELTADQWMLVQRMLGPHEDKYDLAHETFMAMGNAKIVWK